MSPLQRACGLLAVLAALIGNADAQIYKWVDDKGVVHYADQPLQDDAVPAEIVSKRTDRDAARANLAASVALKDQQSQAFYERRDGAEPQADETLTPEQIEFHRKSCEAARAKLTELTQARRLYTLDDDGAKAYLSEEETLAARADVQSAITEHCR